MSIIFSLWLLGTLDSAFSGFRAAAGRNALIDKRAYYIRSLLIGAAYGQAMMAVIAAAVLWFSSTDDWFWSTAVRAAGRFEVLLWPFAGLVLLALVVRLIPSIDLKCISSVVVFGPCVLIRPVVVIVGALYGLWGAMADWRLDLLAAVTVLVILTSEIVLRRLTAQTHQALRTPL